MRHAAIMAKDLDRIYNTLAAARHARQSEGKRALLYAAPPAVNKKVILRLCVQTNHIFLRFLCQFCTHTQAEKRPIFRRRRQVPKVPLSLNKKRHSLCVESKHPSRLFCCCRQTTTFEHGQESFHICVVCVGIDFCSHDCLYI